MEGDVSYKLHGVSTGYWVSGESIVIQRDINACLRQGEFTCLLGPNGAGKTTLLRTLVGFLPPLSGDILIGGKNIRDITASELARLVSIVLTERPSVSSMTVHQLVELGRSPYTGFWGRLSKSDREVVDRSLEMVGVTALSDRMVDTLSDGERQKVMVAKALAQETPVIFLDEPTAFLDFPSKSDMMQLLKRIAQKERKTIFLSTHDLNMALVLADRIWLSDRQMGVEIGTPRELADTGVLRRYFERPGIIFDPTIPSFSVKEME